MTKFALLWVLGAGALLVLLTLALRQRRQIRQLERLLDDTHGKLEQLQLQFARFAPDNVVEHLTDSGGELKASRRTVTVLFADPVAEPVPDWEDAPAPLPEYVFDQRLSC